jgi:RimJ/RimL family protein N-acetyltransferase
MNADAEVMEHLPAVMTASESAASIVRMKEHFRRHGFGSWALELPGVAPFAGYVGLQVVGFEASFTPAVEIAWRIARRFWGNGYVTLAARVALDAAFGPLGLREVVSFTVPANARSWRVMERLGMRRSPDDDFDHPRLPEGHRLRRHILYRITANEWTDAERRRT